MQQGGGVPGGGGGGHQSQYGDMSVPSTTGAVISEQSEQPVEAASPISSRPPATGNLDEFMRLASAGGDDGGDDGDRAGGGGVGVTSGNRWPRQETLALLKIRSDMDAMFRDATVKGPLWEDVSRKLVELGYKRSAKKCKEKFENVHKYYKRTKEGRAGRQDGKSYKFFSELEALHTTSVSAGANVSAAVTPVTEAASLDVAPVSVGIPMPISSVRIPPATTIPMSASILATPGSAAAAAAAPAPVSVPMQAHPFSTTAPMFGISFSSNSSSTSQGFEDDDDDDEDEIGGEPSNMAGTSRKRKRQPSRGGDGTTRRMMEFFKSLMKQVMQKQEAMQQRFLEAIEKREQDRMIREEAWKRQEMARLTREHELMAQERSIAASRDAAIISFLQKITGQTVQLPTTTVTVSAAPPPPPTQPTVQVVPPPVTIATTAPAFHQPPSLPPQQPRSSQQQQQTHSRSQHQHQQQQQQIVHKHQTEKTEVVRHVQQPISAGVVMAIPEQQVPPQEIGGSGSSLEPASSRWPKAEVLALINLRSGLESRYQEAGPKGPLWEEISAGMSSMGYKRSSKRCKEKWENINKYYKKVKESNKKRPEDAKTCPYFHQLDALYRNKILGGGTNGGSGSFSDQHRPDEETSHSQQHYDTSDAAPISAVPPSTQPVDQSEDKTGPTAGAAVTSKEGLPGSLFGEGDGGAAKKPEDTVRELMEEQGMHQQQHHQGQSLLVDYDKIDQPDSDNIDHEEEEEEEDDEDEDDDDEDDEELEEEQKMAYKIEFQRQNASTPNGGGNGAPSFMAMVQ